MNWRAAFFAIAIIAAVAIGLLAYGYVDQSVSLGYTADSYEESSRDLETLAAAFPRDRYNKKDVLAVLRRNNPKAFIVETSCSIQQDGIRFEFDNRGALIGINTHAETTPDKACSP